MARNHDKHWKDKVIQANALHLIDRFYKSIESGIY